MRLLLAREQAHNLAGQAFNIGGGAMNAISLLELIALMASLEGVAPRMEQGDWRPGDQRYYVSNFSKFQAATGWTPKVSIERGVGRLHAWLQGGRDAKYFAVAS